MISTPSSFLFLLAVPPHRPHQHQDLCTRFVSYVLLFVACLISLGISSKMPTTGLVSVSGFNRTDKDAQKEFINLLGPYLRLASKENNEDQFFERAETLWFVRWPLKRSEYEDIEAMQDYKKSTKKVILIFRNPWVPS